MAWTFKRHSDEDYVELTQTENGQPIHEVNVPEDENFFYEWDKNLALPVIHTANNRALIANPTDWRTSFKNKNYLLNLSNPIVLLFMGVPRSHLTLFWYPFGETPNFRASETQPFLIPHLFSDWANWRGIWTFMATQARPSETLDWKPLVEAAYRISRCMYPDEDTDWYPGTPEDAPIPSHLKLPKF